MTTKEYLSQISEFQKQARFYARQIEEIKSLMYSIPGVSYDKDRVQVSVSGDHMLRLIAKADRLTRCWQDRMDRMVEAKTRITEEILQVKKPSYKWLLIYRYVDCMKWTQVAAALGIDDMRHLYRMHGRALKEFERQKNDH